MTLGLHYLGLILWSMLAGMAVFFTRANARLPAGLVRLLHRLALTLGPRRSLNDRDVQDSNSNYGTLLPWWDHLFGTYRTRVPGQPEAAVGVEGWEDQKQLGFVQLIGMPLHPRR